MAEPASGARPVHRTPAGRRFVVTRGTPDDEEVGALGLAIDRLVNLAAARRPGSAWVRSTRPGGAGLSWADADPWNRSTGGWRAVP